MSDYDLIARLDVMIDELKVLNQSLTKNLETLNNMLVQNSDLDGTNI